MPTSVRISAVPDGGRGALPGRVARQPQATGNGAVSTYAYVNPVVAVSFGALFLGERPSPATLVGGVVVVASVAMLLIHRTGNPSRARAERPVR